MESVNNNMINIENITYDKIRDFIFGDENKKYGDDILEEYYDKVYAKYTGEVTYYHPEVRRGVMDCDPEEIEYNEPCEEEFKDEVIDEIINDIIKENKIDTDTVTKDDYKKIYSTIDEVISDNSKKGFPDDYKIHEYYDSNREQMAYQEECDRYDHECERDDDR